MGLDIYVGSMTRYLARDWKTVAAQAAEAEGITFTTIRTEEQGEAPSAEDLAPIVSSWQDSLAGALGVSETWADLPDAPYATDQPHWLGYGALVLLAARLERPDLADPSDSPDQFTQSAAFQAAQQAEQTRFPSLLGGAEWWLPLRGMSATFMGSAFSGDMIAMATLDLLTSELDLLTSELGVDGASLAEALMTGGPEGEQPETPAEAQAYLAAWGVFGLAVFSELARQAQRMQLPLLLDY